LWSCTWIESPAGIAALASLGSWAIAFSGRLAKCTGSRRCRVHGHCRRCLSSAALSAVRHGFGGLCLGLIAASVVPANAPLIAAMALLSGLANYSMTHWRSLGDDLIEIVLAVRNRRNKE